MIDQLHQLTRPLVTIMFAGAIVAGFLTGRIAGETLIGVAGPVIAFWFAQRTSDQRKTDTLGGAATPPVPAANGSSR